MAESVIKSVKLPKSLAHALARVAHARGCTESDLIREGIEWITQGDEGFDMQVLIGPDVGIGRGPRDLSSSRAHRAGYGRSRHR